MPDEQGVVIGTKRFLAVHDPHPAATYTVFIFISFYNYNYLLCRARATAKEVFFMKTFFKNFVDSAKEFGNLKSLVTAALLVALHTVLAFFLSIQITPSLRISLSFLAKVVTGCLFGPVVGFVSGGVSDIIQFVLKPTGPYFIGWTINAALAGLIYGIFFYRKFPKKAKAIDFSFLARCILALTLETVLVNVLLGTYWLSVMYGKGFAFYLSSRLAKNLIQLPINIVLAYCMAVFVRQIKNKI